MIKRLTGIAKPIQGNYNHNNIKHNMTLYTMNMRDTSETIMYNLSLLCVSFQQNKKCIRSIYSSLRLYIKLQRDDSVKIS